MSQVIVPPFNEPFAGEKHRAHISFSSGNSARLNLCHERGPFSVCIKREKTRAGPDLHRAGLADRVYGENVPSMSGNVIAELPVTDVWVLPWAVPNIAMPPPTLRFSVET